ncbi:MULTISPECIES: hypothetical protein [Pseudoalteromonas]|uniref:Uncharacterized protein n=2 Tax=Pseudoalteromonas TaxID=53246 RepID=V4HR10_PSEL2|nr:MULTISPECIES: hypothetical protein [Pseudoalteromonas]ESP93275.1 hypothetical protein PL2TA16_03496 [Pseudoalteromonas luteoviolacea 2ta16]KZN36607.1 hypothetical protein N483_22065 [Pseudoalteromonas luteoviolacea NCIMB 1944]MBQ4839624.1 hypothetical protein [Pseudoalteromonas luteoviolacea]MCG7550365.1 hypothetical protein [Pseudoalteromonas sp. Of7M-16]MDK2593770.1 hypothetical protein [Pseudoalteromonas sp. P94(2023)]
MPVNNRSNLRALIEEHQVRQQQYQVAENKVQSYLEYNRHCLLQHLNNLFTKRVLPHLELAKALLMEQGYQAEIEVEKQTLHEENSAIEVITQVSLLFSGNPDDQDVSLTQNRLLIFTRPNHAFIYAKYITDLVTSQTQPLFFADEFYYQNMPNVDVQFPHFPFPPNFDDHSEFKSMLSDFLSMVFLQIRGKLS